ncbi:hypothetical protein [Aureimonas glaciei]|uniref:Uncharacterized protein n=1 Tax=Aureimonas glaciei TaxID=1776957 RepID=A0A916Y0J6_9HYPH|nr:hypothetical protein [Aureimonas glaciei]GGD24313.1 hypothetical protein GCM10011335_29050 [Aureimonas glaciei]
MRERGYEFDRLPPAAQDDIARLEIELYDAKGTILHAGAAFLIGVGALSIAFAWLREIWSFVYTGSATTGVGFGLLWIVVGVIFYARSDRANRRSMD